MPVRADLPGGAGDARSFVFVAFTYIVRSTATDRTRPASVNKLVVRQATRLLPLCAELFDTVARHQRDLGSSRTADYGATSCFFCRPSRTDHSGSDSAAFGGCY